MHAGDVDDHPAAASGDEPARGLASAEKRTREVDRQHLVPLVQRHVDQAEGFLDACVVDQHINRTTELITGSCEHV